MQGMEASEASQTPTSSPFDAIAPSYDDDFTSTRLGLWLRTLVWKHLDRVFLPGDHVLELGCGTGDDAMHLARRGIHVSATDASSEMLALASEKTISAGLGDKISFHQWDLTDPDPPRLLSIPSNGFDGILSNFGVLNCLPSRRPLAKPLDDWLKPKGKAVFVMMNPVCPWEIGWHLTHGQFREAFRRFGKGVLSNIGAGKSLRVWYPSPRQIQDDFSPHFRGLDIVGVGALLPPTYLHPLVVRFPTIFNSLKNLEYKYSHRFPLSHLNDHYLIVLEKR